MHSDGEIAQLMNHCETVQRLHCTVGMEDKPAACQGTPAFRLLVMRSRTKTALLFCSPNVMSSWDRPSLIIRLWN